MEQKGASPNGFEHDKERAREAGRKGGSMRPLRTILKDVLNEKLPPKQFAEIKDKYGLSENITQGEDCIRALVHSARRTGDHKAISEIMKITGEYTEKLNVDIPQGITINITPANADKHKPAE